MIRRIDVGEEDRFVVKPIHGVIKKVTTPKEKPWLIHVPAAAATHEW
jgi:hypothetical protein